MTYDMFNMPLSNSLAGTIDPTTGKDACPISAISRIGVGDPTQTASRHNRDLPEAGIGWRITLSPLAGQAVVANLMPDDTASGHTGADRIDEGRRVAPNQPYWTARRPRFFLRIGERSFFQEFGPAATRVHRLCQPGDHHGRLKAFVTALTRMSQAVTAANTVTGNRHNRTHESTPDERLYSSGTTVAFAFYPVLRERW